MEWIKAFHIMMMTSWFAGLFYLPRLFVNHAMSEHDTVHKHLAMMEAKLYRFVTPIMILTVISGVILTYDQWAYFSTQWWYGIKIAVVLLLIVYHFYCGHLVKVFAEHCNERNHVFYRFFNEVPVFGLMAVLVLVFVRPF